ESCEPRVPARRNSNSSTLRDRSRLMLRCCTRGSSSARRTWQRWRALHPAIPRTVVCIRRTAGRSDFEVIDGDRKHWPDVVETLNDLLIKSARRWVVATTKLQLEQLSNELSQATV